VESQAGPEGVSIALNFRQMPHLGVEHPEVFTPLRMKLKRVFSGATVHMAREVLERAARRLGLAKPPRRQYV